MSRTHRSDTTYLPGDHHSGDRGLGYAGSTIPSEGEHGPGLLYPQITLPAESNDEFRLVFTSIPAGVTILEASEDSSLVAEADSPGTYSGTYDAYKNGVLYGSSTWTLNFGDGLGGAITLDALQPSGSIAGYIAPPPTPALTNEQMQQLYVWIQELHRIHGLESGVPLVVTPTQRTAGTITQHVSEAGDTVTVERA